MARQRKTPKYKNYKELAAAFKAGELPGFYIMIDKGGSLCRLCWGGEGGVRQARKMNKLADELFGVPEYGEHITALFEALGIPAEWA